MKKRTKWILGLSLLFGLTLTAAGCSYPHAPYGDLAKDGFGVNVRYDRNGGVFASTEGIDLIDVYGADGLQNGVKLIAPGDALRGAQASTSSATRSGYFLAGWYRTRTPRTDASGNPLDDYGVLCSESGREQGYIYGGKWDFANDYLHLADVTPVEGKENTYTVTLYAGWIPNFTYTFYRPAEEGETGWQAYGSFAINPLNTASIPVPAWNEETGRMDYGSFAVYTGHTLLNAYADGAQTAPFEGTIAHTGKIDYESGTASGFDVPVYTTWEMGTWFQISRPAQLVSNVQLDGCYRLTADVDFSETTSRWPFGSLAFSGTFDGQGHTVKNVSTTQDSGSLYAGGLFGELTAKATVKNVSFQTVVFDLQSGTRLTGGMYGLFAGRINAQAAVEGVALSGEIRIGNLIDVNNGAFDNFTIGLISGNLEEKGVARDNITVTVKRVAIGYDSDGVAVNGYPLKAQVLANGSVAVSKNPDPSQDPNL